MEQWGECDCKGEGACQNCWGLSAIRKLKVKLEQVEKDRDLEKAERESAWNRMKIAQDILAASDKGLDDGALWSFFRGMLVIGGAQELDYQSGKYKSYEEFSAHVDASARDYVEKFRALANPQPQSK